MPATVERSLLTALRVTIGWVFLYAGFTQVMDPAWSAAGFLNQTTTFHFLFAPFAASDLLPITNFLVEWGHLAIGFSLVTGALTRVGSVFGILLLAYWLAHMNFPYVESKVNFLIDYHVVYAIALLFLLNRQTDETYGLDHALSSMTAIKNSPFLRPLMQ